MLDRMRGVCSFRCTLRSAVRASLRGTAVSLALLVGGCAVADNGALDNPTHKTSHGSDASTSAQKDGSTVAADDTGATTSTTTSPDADSGSGDDSAVAADTSIGDDGATAASDSSTGDDAADATTVSDSSIVDSGVIDSGPVDTGVVDTGTITDTGTVRDSGGGTPCVYCGGTCASTLVDLNCFEMCVLCGAYVDCIVSGSSCTCL
jgi:hypothetical protein